MSEWLNNLPDIHTVSVIVDTACIFTVIMCLWVYYIVRWLLFSKIKSQKYVAKKFFKDHEKKLFILLERILRENYTDKYILLFQVRLADMFSREVVDDDWWVSIDIRGHVDFLIVDHKSFKPVLAIELNWKTHYAIWQQVYDTFKRTLFNNEFDIPLKTVWNSDIDKWEWTNEKIAWLLRTYLK